MTVATGAGMPDSALDHALGLSRRGLSVIPVPHPGVPAGQQRPPCEPSSKTPSSPIACDRIGVVPDPVFAAGLCVMPTGLTTSRADLVTWWRWRYSTLAAEGARQAELLVEALTDAQSYRQVLQATLDSLHDLTTTVDRQRQTIARLHAELRGLREPVRRAAT